MLAFWERYTDNVQTRYNRDVNMSHDGPSDGDIFVFMHGLKLIGKTRAEHIDDKVRDKLVWYVLNNCDEVQPYVEYDFLSADLLFPMLRTKCSQ
jgi:hypothetical protein